MIDLKKLNDQLKELKQIIKTSDSDFLFFNEFVSPLVISDIKNNNIIIKTVSDWSKVNLTNNYKQQFDQFFSKKNNEKMNCCFVGKNEQFNETKFDENIIHTNVSKPIGLNKNFTFDNFVVGGFNKTAFNACKTLFSKKIMWNPIFISGDVGLGKTHLLHAIGNEFHKLYPEKKIKYISADNFIREIYNALSKDANTLEKVKEEYESMDLFLLDDIQFLEGKEKINEIFFNLFNKNIQDGKIIVMTSDKDPSYLRNVEDRIKSRIQSGLFIKIKSPELSSVKSIFEKKVNEYETSYIFTQDAIDYVCRRNVSDIRKLEGFINRILFYAINNLPPNAIITLDIVKNNTEVEKYEMIKNIGYDIDPRQVIEIVCNIYNVSSDLVTSKSRLKNLNIVRHVCMYILKRKFNMPYNQIGSYFSGRNHSTVLEAVEKINTLMEKDPNLKQFIENIYKKI